MGACDLVLPTKRLPGNYRLLQFEGHSYFVTREGGPHVDRGGELQGAIGALGWSDHYIVANRSRMRSDLQPGWMILDIRTGEMKGPFTDAQFADAVRRDGDLAAIRVRPVQEAWKELGWPPW